MRDNIPFEELGDLVTTGSLGTGVLGIGSLGGIGVCGGLCLLALLSVSSAGSGGGVVGSCCSNTLDIVTCFS